MFTTPCYIQKNTPELIKRLDDMGYFRANNYSDNPNRLLCTYIGGHIIYDKDFNFKDLGSDYTTTSYLPLFGVYCGKNEKLFLAMAALRNDSDKNQWFTIDRDCMYNKDDDPQDKSYWYLCDNDDYRFSDGLSYDQGWHEWHKATPEELIEHFMGNDRESKKYKWHDMESGNFPNNDEVICLLKSGIVVSGFPYKNNGKYFVATQPCFEFEEPSSGECDMWMEMPNIE